MTDDDKFVNHSHIFERLLISKNLGVDFKVKVLEATGSDGKKKRVKITIWDTAGQERFRTLTSSYYRGAQGIILGKHLQCINSQKFLSCVIKLDSLSYSTVYDISRKETFDSLDMWLQEVETFACGGGRG